MKSLLITEVFPPQTGGSGRWFWEIYRRLDPSRTTILAGSQPGDVAFDAGHSLNVVRTELSFPTWGVVSRQGLACYRRLIAKIEQLMDEQQLAQLHCGKVLPEGFAAWRLKRKRGAAYLVYVHGEELNVSAGSRELRWMTRRALRSADRVIANSENTAHLLREDWKVSREQLSVLHPGVDIERFHPAQRDPEVRKQLGWGERPVVLTVGRLQKRKGQDQLIRSLPALVESHPDLLYSIVGDGSEREPLGRLVSELGMEKHVDFRGEASDAEMVSCYQQCDLFALPNRTVDGDFEGFGMVLLEAQACGKPVVAGASGGTSEAMRDGLTGYVVDCTSTTALAVALGGLLHNEAQRTLLGQAGREWVVENFGWDALVEKAEGVFGRCANAVITTK